MIDAWASLSAAATRGIAFFCELRLKRRQRLRVAGREHVLRRLKPLLGIGIGERERSHRALNGISERIVDADLLEGGGVDAFNRRAGLGVEDCARGGLIGDEMVGGIDQQAVVAERIQNRRRLRGRFGRQFADCGLSLRELVGEELGQRVVERIGASRGRRQQRARRRRARGGRLERDAIGSNRGRHRDPRILVRGEAIQR